MTRRPQTIRYHQSRRRAAEVDSSRLKEHVHDSLQGVIREPQRSRR